MKTKTRAVANPMIPVTVKTYRDAGLEAKWGRYRYAPAIFVRDPKGRCAHQRDQWWMLTGSMYKLMERELGKNGGDVSKAVRDGFDGATLLADMFSI